VGSSIYNTSSGSTNVISFFLDSAALRLFLKGGTGTNPVDSTVTLAANTPYFVAASINWSTRCLYLVKNLRTGQVQFNAATSAITVVGAAFSGTLAMPGGNSAIANSFAGAMAAAMYAPQQMSLSALLQWAEDPRAFWYPQPEENWVGIYQSAEGEWCAMAAARLRSARSLDEADAVLGRAFTVRYRPPLPSF
jgi:hypothetical protein